MSTSASHTVDNSLTSTLILALSQCQTQVRELAERSKIIDELRAENEKLKRELQEQQALSKSEIEAKYAAQVQDTFKKVAEKQAEVDGLKDKLRNVKIKARQRRLTDLITSSPSIPSASAESFTPQMLQLSDSVGHSDVSGEKAKVDHQKPQAVASVTGQKRRRSSSTPPSPLQEVSGNVDAAAVHSRKGDSTTSKRKCLVDRAVAAIPDIAEDGDDQRKVKHRSAESKSTNIPNSIYNRLGDLLDSRGPDSPLLAKARSSSPPPTRHIPFEATPARPSSTDFGLHTPRTQTRSKRPRSSLAGSKRVMSTIADGSKSLRSKPLEQLGLAHFKINPASNAGLDYAYNETVRGQNRKCVSGCTRECCAGTFNALAASLSDLRGPNGQLLTDDEVLIRFLGSGSEERIRNMTQKARENLLHEARTKLVADAYGKMHRDAHERGRSPPDFWRTDMPGSQEHRANRELAKMAEREEIKKRYEEAMKEGGHWIFADE